MTTDDYIKLGKDCREAKDNMVIGAFAAELVGESYPFSTAMSAIVFKSYSDEQLGRKFAAWCDK